MEVHRDPELHNSQKSASQKPVSATNLYTISCHQFLTWQESTVYQYVLLNEIFYYTSFCVFIYIKRLN